MSSVRPRQPPPIKSITSTLLNSPRQPQHSHCGTSAGLLHAVGRIQQVPQLRRAVVRGDPRGPVPQEVLAVLEGHTRRPEPPTERVTQVMHPYVPEARWSLPAELHGIPTGSPSPGLNPPGIAEVPDSIPPAVAVLPGKDVYGMLPAHLFERSEEHTSELQSRLHLVCRLLLEKKQVVLGRLELGQHRERGVRELRSEAARLQARDQRVAPADGHEPRHSGRMELADPGVPAAEPQRRELGDRLREGVAELLPARPDVRHAELPRGERVADVPELLAEVFFFKDGAPPNIVARPQHAPLRI